MLIEANYLPQEAINNLYGVDTRFNFCVHAISQLRPTTVLDFGCGTGEYLTVPLAKRFPDIQFTAFDADTHTVALAAASNRLKNLTFTSDPRKALLESGYNLVIASEVLEHVEHPSEVLSLLRQTLTPEGKIILTVPNGFGPFELLSLVRSIYVLFGICYLVHALRKIKWRLERRPQATSVRASQDTAALSPHVNFFSYSALKNLIASSGFSIDHFANRSFISGFGFDHLFCRQSFIRLNKKAAKVVPPNTASSWMLLASKVPKTVISPKKIKVFYSSGIRRRLVRRMTEYYFYRH